MKTRQVGHCGLKLTELAIGTATFGGSTGKEEAFGILDRAYGAGIRVIDTSDSYPQIPGRIGMAEAVVGEWLSSRGVRDEMVVATKVNYPMGSGPNSKGLSRLHVVREIEQSLRRLGAERIDLYQAHQYDLETPMSEVVEVFEGLVRTGKIAYYGVANWSAWQVSQALEMARSVKAAGLACVQTRYSLLSREPEDELIPACRANGLGVVTFNGLAGGLLTGRYTREESPASNTRFGQEGVSSSGRSLADIYRERYWTPAHFAAVQDFERECAERGLAKVSVALAWILRKRQVSSVILGASHGSQLDEQLAAPEIQMSDDEWRRFDDIWWTIPRRPPHDSRIDPVRGVKRGEK